MLEILHALVHLVNNIACWGFHYRLVCLTSWAWTHGPPSSSGIAHWSRLICYARWCTRIELAYIWHRFSCIYPSLRFVLPLVLQGEGLRRSNSECTWHCDSLHVSVHAFKLPDHFFGRSGTLRGFYGLSETSINVCGIRFQACYSLENILLSHSVGKSSRLEFLWDICNVLLPFSVNDRGLGQPTFALTGCLSPPQGAGHTSPTITEAPSKSMQIMSKGFMDFYAYPKIFLDFLRFS